MTLSIKRTGNMYFRRFFLVASAPVDLFLGVTVCVVAGIQGYAQTFMSVWRQNPNLSYTSL